MAAVDQFDAHFAAPEKDDIDQRLIAINDRRWYTSLERHPSLGKIIRIGPDTPGSRKRKLNDYVSDVSLFDLKKRLLAPATRYFSKPTELQSSLVPVLAGYQDLLYGARTPQNAKALRSLTALHAINHVFKTRDRVIENNAKASDLNNESGSQRDLRDQGFTRPKVLILLETRQQCVKWVDAIVALSDSDQQENRKRFQDAFNSDERKFGDDKPDDFLELFEGNGDNDFRIGLKFTRRATKFYAPFYSSDVILASPLGLRRSVKADNPKKADHDFLSSIELCIADQVDAMLMQNWEHVEFAFEHLNRQPQDPHGCDFSRVRQWYLDGHAKHFRQTLVYSAYLTPELNALFNQHMNNVAGKVKIMPEYSGSMLDLDVRVRQTFNRISAKDPALDPDERFKYFTTIMLPAIMRIPQPVQGGIGVVLFIPNYYDFVRVRNYFAGDSATQDLSFGAVSEYDEPSVSQRARSHFFSGKHSILLYTGRAHHFRRLLIRGVKRVYFYGLPENPVFYNELVQGFIGSSLADGNVHQDDAIIKALFSKWEGMALERIVGTSRAKRMLREGTGDTFDFR